MEVEPQKINMGYPVHAWIGAPIISKDQVIAFITLDKEESDYYTDQHAERLETFASQAALALENARLFEEVQNLAITDPLTKLNNRRHFFELAIRETDRSMRHHHPLSAIMLDIRSLQTCQRPLWACRWRPGVACRRDLCQNNLRQHDIIGRYGGEEFVMLFPETNLEKCREIAQRMCQYIARMPIETQRGNLSMTVSLGVAALDFTNLSPDAATTVENWWITLTRLFMQLNMPGVIKYACTPILNMW